MFLYSLLTPSKICMPSVVLSLHLPSTVVNAAAEFCFLLVWQCWEDVHVLTRVTFG